MQVPLSWLKEYVSIDVPLEELAERLTLAGLEVAEIAHVGREWSPEHIVVGQVLQVRPHPNADRLVLVTVDYGRGEPLEVVTGAPNLPVGQAGQKVVFATVGARLVDPYADTLRYQTLKRAKIRGVTSQGMVCSEKELGLSDEHEGIVILPPDAPVGQPLAEYWGDVVLDIDLTPNLARCQCIVGVAREVAALTGAALRLPEPEVREEGPAIAGRVTVAIADPDLCARYSAALVEGVTIGPSPSWMQRRLRLAGMRPISNVVDITNYVMLEWGQPLHAFDYRLLRPEDAGGAPAIIVRRAEEGERITTLDGEERRCSRDMLLITDGGGPVAVAGVMGGLESEVTEATRDVLLEAASFDNISVRRTSAALRLSSEAAQRFGRGVDPELTATALRRAAELMRTLAGGTVAEGIVDAYPRPPQPKTITLAEREVTRQLGVRLPTEEIARLLRALEFECEVMEGPAPQVRARVPSYRLDVTVPADLVEEVARLYGYDRLPATRMADALPPQERAHDLELEEGVRDLLVGCGLTEVITYSLTNLESVGRLQPKPSPPPAEGYLRLANPLTREQSVLRQTLLNTILECAAQNLRHAERVALFEIAHVYLPRQGEALPKEPSRLAVLLSGPREPLSWLAPASPPMDFYDLKGVLEALAGHLGLELHLNPTSPAAFHPGRAAVVLLAEREVGVLGEVHPQVRDNYDLPGQAVCLMELDLNALLAAAQPERTYRPVSRMPALREDLAVVVPEGTAADAVRRAIIEACGPLLESVVLFDVYRGRQIGADEVSLAFRLTFRSPDVTLTSEQAADLRQRALRRLEADWGARLRA